MTVKEYAQQHDYHFGHMTIGQCISTAIELHMTVGRVILEEAVSFTGKTYDEIVARSVKISMAEMFRSLRIHSSIVS